jgi:hypothetical protein
LKDQRITDLASRGDFYPDCDWRPSRANGERVFRLGGFGIERSRLLGIADMGDKKQAK